MCRPNPGSGFPPAPTADERSRAGKPYSLPENILPNVQSEGITADWACLTARARRLARLRDSLATRRVIRRQSQETFNRARTEIGPDGLGADHAVGSRNAAMEGQSASATAAAGRPSRIGKRSSSAFAGDSGDGMQLTGRRVHSCLGPLRERPRDVPGLPRRDPRPSRHARRRLGLSGQLLLRTRSSRRATSPTCSSP